MNISKRYRNYDDEDFLSKSTCEIAVNAAIRDFQKENIKLSVKDK